MTAGIRIAAAGFGVPANALIVTSIPIVPSAPITPSALIAPSMPVGRSVSRRRPSTRFAGRPPTIGTNLVWG
ncbi:hypothetical protein FAIPA1_110084 [Frankia sp. AiPs1]